MLRQVKDRATDQGRQPRHWFGFFLVLPVELAEQGGQDLLLEIVTHLDGMTLSLNVRPRVRKPHAKSFHQLATMSVRFAWPGPLNSQRRFTPALGAPPPAVRDQDLRPRADNLSHYLRAKLKRHTSPDWQEIQSYSEHLDVRQLSH